MRPHELSPIPLLGLTRSMENLTRSEISYYLQRITRTHNLTHLLPRNGSVWADLDSEGHLDFQEESDAVIDQCFPLLDMLDFCHSYYIPAIIFVGLVGNFLACVVFLHTHLKMRSSSYYLAALAMADFGFLFVLLLVWLNSNYVGIQVFNREGWCQCLVYISSVCSFLSVWLIVAFTVERFIAVQYPLQRPNMCTVTRAKVIVVSLTVLALVSHSYSFVTAGLVRQKGGDPVCELRTEYEETMRIINILDSIVTLIVPLTLIIVMNTMITRNLLRFSRRFKDATPDLGDCPSGGNRSDINLNQLPMVISRTEHAKPCDVNSALMESSSSNNRQSDCSNNRRHSSSSNNRNQSTSSENRRQQQQSFHSRQMSRNENHHAIQHEEPAAVTTSRTIHMRTSRQNLVSTRTQQNITKMLLIISTVFVLLNLPSYVIRLYIFIFFSFRRQITPPSLWCMQQFFMLLYYTNFSINFLLYSMCGITFRRCLKQLLRNTLKKLIHFPCKAKNCVKFTQKN